MRFRDHHERAALYYNSVRCGLPETIEVESGVK